MCLCIWQTCMFRRWNKSITLTLGGNAQFDVGLFFYVCIEWFTAINHGKYVIWFKEKTQIIWIINITIFFILFLKFVFRTLSSLEISKGSKVNNTLNICELWLFLFCLIVWQRLIDFTQNFRLYMHVCTVPPLKCTVFSSFWRIHVAFYNSTLKFQLN